LPQLPGYLPVAHIDTVNFSDSCLQETVGKASGRNSSIEGNTLSSDDRELGEGMGEFFATSRNEGRLCLNLNDGSEIDFGARFVDHSLVDSDLSRPNRPLGLLARCAKLEIDEACIETLFGHNVAKLRLMAYMPGKLRPLVSSSILLRMVSVD
jgi:hypothetical protein